MRISTTLLLTLVAIIPILSFGQHTERGDLPPQKEKEYTQWKKVTADGVSYEYRIAFSGKRALTCNYLLEIKNTSDAKLKLKIVTHYMDRLVKQRFGDTFKETLKPGKDKLFEFLTQGAKAGKDMKDVPDGELCLKGCDFFYEIIAEKE